MPEMINRKFLIYEYAPGCARSLRESSRRGKIMLESENGITIAAEFVYSDEIEPAVECEISIKPSAMSRWPNEKYQGKYSRCFTLVLDVSTELYPKATIPNMLL